MFDELRGEDAVGEQRATSSSARGSSKCPKRDEITQWLEDNGIVRPPHSQWQRIAQPEARILGIETESDS